MEANELAFCPQSGLAHGKEGILTNMTEYPFLQYLKSVSAQSGKPLSTANNLFFSFDRVVMLPLAGNCLFKGFS